MSPRRTSAPLVPAADQDPYLESLAGELEIDVGALERELAAHPYRFYLVGVEVARRTVVRDARRRDWRAASARVDGLLRRAAKERGTEVSDAAAAVQVGSHADVVRAARALDGAKEAVRAARALQGAFHARGRMLGALVALRTKK